MSRIEEERLEKQENLSNLVAILKVLIANEHTGLQTLDTLKSNKQGSEVKMLEQELAKNLSTLKELISKILSLGSTEAYNVLLECLYSKESLNLRIEAAFALGFLGKKQAIQPLLELLANRNEDSYLLHAVVYALGMLQAVQAVEPLIEALKELGYPHKELYVHKKKFVEQLQSKNIDEEVIQNYSNYVSSLYKKSKQSFVYKPQVIVQSLGQIGDGKSVKILIELLKNDEMIPDAITALGLIGDKSALPYIRQFLDNENEVSRWGGGPIKAVAKRAIDQILQ